VSVLRGAASGILLGLVALAPVTAQAHSPYRSAESWTGFYAGLNLGGGWGDSDVTYPNFPASNSSPDLGGVVGGGQLGFNKQWGSLVLGAEVTFTNGPRANELTVGGNERQSVDVDFVFQALGRIGYAWGPTLLYALGGYAAGNVDERLQNTGNANAIFDKQWHNGWVAGAGLEYLAHPNVVLGIEWRHVDLGDDIHSGNNNFGGAVATRNHRVDLNYDVVSARISYKFGDRRDEPLK
jgi:outer membrane immunogenic protein